MAKFPDPTKEYKAEPLSQPPAIEPPNTEQPKSEDATTQATPPKEELPPVLTSPVVSTPVSEEVKKPIPSSAVVSPSPFRNLIPLILGLGVFGIIIFIAFRILPGLFNKPQEQITLTYWGLWEPSSVMQDVIADYEIDNPNVKIAYSMQSPKNYRARLQSAIEQGSGPDIARIHNTWVPLFADLLVASETTTLDKLKTDYYPVIAEDLTYQGQVYALPLMIDGLALYYNVDIFEQKGLTPPTDWNSLRKTAFDLTVRNPNTNIIEQAGIALGTTGNVTHWSDILGLLILQNSGDPAVPDSQAVEDAIAFYTTFASLDKTWDETQPNDVYAFATGTVAMIIAPSWQIPTITSINPDLKFQVIPAPTLPETSTSWATYWAEAVPTTSKNKQEAWKFIEYLSSRDVLQKLYVAQSQERRVGEVYPRLDMASLLSQDPILGAFVNQGSSYTSWYLSSKTHDEALNDELIKYYEDAVNAVVMGNPYGSVSQTLKLGVDQVMAKYQK